MSVGMGVLGVNSGCLRDDGCKAGHNVCYMRHNGFGIVHAAWTLSCKGNRAAGHILATTRTWLQLDQTGGRMTD